MKSEFLAGFVKSATEAGYSDDGVATLWKIAMSDAQVKEYFDSLPVSSSPLDVNTLTVLSRVKQAMDHKEEVERLKETLKDICG